MDLRTAEIVQELINEIVQENSEYRHFVYIQYDRFLSFELINIPTSLSSGVYLIYEDIIWENPKRINEEFITKKVMEAVDYLDNRINEYLLK